MNIRILDYEDLYALDGFWETQNAEQIDAEIEQIVSGLWSGVGEAEPILRPFFTTFLQSNLLRPLYINYFSLRAMLECNPKVVIRASHSILDIAANALGVELAPSRTLHDEEFYLVRHYLFEQQNKHRTRWRRVAHRLLWPLFWLKGFMTGIDVLFLNAGKLEKDLNELGRSLSAHRIPPRQSTRCGWDIPAIRNQVCANLEQLSLSIPKACILQLLELRVFAYLSDVSNRIGALAETIEQLKVRLVIASAFTHEDHLCLLAAAKLTGVDSLMLTHGVTFAKNIFLDDYATYQATLCEIDPQYAGASQFQMRYQWFERKV